MHEDVTSAWDRVTEQWDDPARHDALLALVVQHNCFAWAAARYKERSGDAIADRQLDRLRRAATATMLATATARTRKEETPYRKVIVWLAVMLAMLLLGLVLTRIIVDIKAPVTTPAPP